MWNMATIAWRKPDVVPQTQQHPAYTYGYYPVPKSVSDISFFLGSNL